MDDKRRAILLRTMRDFSRFCDKAGLGWFMAFGAAIGTVRHKGMIPWDDDIDVYMPRPDYERLVAIVNGVASDSSSLLHNGVIQGDEGSYSVIGPRVSQDYWPFPYLKFSDNSSIIWEQEKYRCVTGVFVDIFPLDETDGDMARNDELKSHYHKVFGKYKRSGRYNDITMRNLIPSLLDAVLYRPRAAALKDDFCALDKAMASIHGDHYITWAAISPSRKVCFPKEWAESWTEADFEGFKVRLPIGNDKILRSIYGDYMQLPPKYERISNHHQFFADFGKRMSVEEIDAAMKSGMIRKFGDR